jgi:SAM-dependent methyltransferase
MMVVPSLDVTAYPRESVACNLCGGVNTTTLAEHDRYGLPVRVVQCACGLRYLNPRWTAEGYAQFYRDGYRPLIAHWMQIHGDPAQTVEAIEADQQTYGLLVRGAVGPWMREGQHVLDIGGSTGVVGRLFKARWGGTVTVIDPAPDELARATGCQTICGSAETVDFPKADVALLCRTIDHLLDPKGVLLRLRQAVTRLVVDAMDVDAWNAPHRYKVDHPYAFTGKTLQQMVKAAGWRIERAWLRRNRKYVGLLCSPQE